MNYYSFHVGDYASHTAHLTEMEDLVYRRLLDLYYSREKALPSDAGEVGRLIRLKDQLEVVKAVLSEFFQATGEGWRHNRCDAELAKMRDKQAKARAAASASACVRSAGAKRTQSGRSADAELPIPIPTPTPTPTPTRELSIESSSLSSPTEVIPAKDEREKPPEPVLREDRRALNSDDLEVQRPPSDVVGQACAAIQAAGISGVRPSDPDFRALLQAGATAEEFAANAAVALDKADGDPWRYLVAIVRGNRTRERALQASVAAGSMPPLRQAFPAQPAPPADPTARRPGEADWAWRKRVRGLEFLSISAQVNTTSLEGNAHVVPPSLR